MTALSRCELVQACPTHPPFFMGDMRDEKAECERLEAVACPCPPPWLAAAAPSHPPWPWPASLTSISTWSPPWCWLLAAALQLLAVAAAGLRAGEWCGACEEEECEVEEDRVACCASATATSRGYREDPDSQARLSTTFSSTWNRCFFNSLCTPWRTQGEVLVLRGVRTGGWHCVMLAYIACMHKGFTDFTGVG